MEYTRNENCQHRFDFPLSAGYRDKEPNNKLRGTFKNAILPATLTYAFPFFPFFFYGINEKF